MKTTPFAAPAPPAQPRDNPPTCSTRRTEFSSLAEQNPIRWADGKSNVKSAPGAPAIPKDTEHQTAIEPPSTPRRHIAPHPCPDISQAESTPARHSPPRWNPPAHNRSSAQHHATANPPACADSASPYPNMEFHQLPSPDRYKNPPSLSPPFQKPPKLPASRPSIAKTPAPRQIPESPK